MGRTPRLSGLQRQVLSLYRSALRVARAKEQQGGESMAAYVRQEFETNRRIDRRDFQRIEHFIRKGRKQLELLSAAETTAVRVSGSSSGGSSSAAAGSSTSSSAAYS